MNKTLQLKIAALILFWFGIGSELIVLFVVAGQYFFDGYSKLLTPYSSNQMLLNVANFTYTLFGHFLHITAAYWLSKGRMKGWILGMSIGVYEIVAFLIPNIDPDLLTVRGFIIRIIFVVAIYLMVVGKKELITLQTENWRPWKNPRTIST